MGTRPDGEPTRKRQCTSQEGPFNHLASYENGLVRSSYDLHGTQGNPFVLEDSPPPEPAPNPRSNFDRTHAKPAVSSSAYDFSDTTRVLVPMQDSSKRPSDYHPFSEHKHEPVGPPSAHNFYDENGALQVPSSKSKQPSDLHLFSDYKHEPVGPPSAPYLYDENGNQQHHSRPLPVDAVEPASHVPLPVVEPPLCKEQSDLVSLIMSGRNVFYTGSAGCGKSTVLKAFVKRFHDMAKVVHILAPTGRAALAVNGVTTWNYVGWLPNVHNRMSMEELLNPDSKWLKHVLKRLTDTDILVIDEISMVENFHFERINKFMQQMRKNDSPFGGVQLVVTGDFCQLPPVKPFKHCIQCGTETIEIKTETEYKCREHGSYFDKDKWAFRSKAWKDCNFVHVNLEEIHRQSDAVFIHMLQKLRLGVRLTKQEIDHFENHPTPGFNVNAIKLFGTRFEVKRENDKRFNVLRSPAHTYQCIDYAQINKNHANLQHLGNRTEDGKLTEFDFDPDIKEKRGKEHKYESEIKLKKGMAVVLLTNIDIKNGLVNGAQGVIQGFKDYDPALMPKTMHEGGSLMGDYAKIKARQIQTYIDQFDRSGRPELKKWPEVRFPTGKFVIMADCLINEFGDKKPYTLLGRTQIPLAAGYAITVHKSQGMTLDKVEVNLSKTFAAGQVYVALSRARSLAGLQVFSFPRDKLIETDETVQEFLRDKFPLVYAALDQAPSVIGERASECKPTAFGF